eukprot:TRINITY_DN63901_c0_g1_i1.p1 TRINITY_DN63901_c0_g1~~TRINITY_DN63901_c0_g1_i1.p1  ORF type:complete len:829 (+),score=195.34 TRINITY_DN63901_c0_g1_i1:270-2489(+)
MAPMSPKQEEEYPEEWDEQLTEAEQHEPMREEGEEDVEVELEEQDRNMTKEEPQNEEDRLLDNDSWRSDFEKKWAAAMGQTSSVAEVKNEERKRPSSPEGLPPHKRNKATPSTAPTDKAAAAAAAAAALFGRKKAGASVSKAPLPLGKMKPREPAGPPPRRQKEVSVKQEVPIKEEAPITPGTFASYSSSGRNEEKIRDEHPEWATRCTLDPARPGQPQRLTVNMAEVDFADADIAEWCSWMDRRLSAEQPPKPGAKGRFKATTIDFSENKLAANGIKALCNFLEKHGVRCDVLRLTGNMIGNEGIRCVARYMTSSSQAPAVELHLSRNRATTEGVKWLLSSLAMHPAYPIWNSESDRYVPLWLRMENNRLKADAGHVALETASSSYSCAVCLGEKSGDIRCGPRQCVNVGCCDELKHNCVVHLTGWEVPKGSAALPAPAAHARPFFAAGGKPKAAPSGAEEPWRDEPRLLYEDEDLAVVLKPSGWTSQPRPQGVDPTWARLKPLARRAQVAKLMTQDEPAPLQAWLLLQFGADPNCDASRDQTNDRGVVHRLEEETSGPLLVAKTSKGYEHARKQILLGLQKDYVALVHGTFSSERGECHAPVDTSPYADTRCVRTDASGQPATTVWEAIAEYESPDKSERYTLVHCRMVTLRTHQLRVHLQHMGHPLVGDELYGAGSTPDWCPRLFLHKLRIGFFNVKGQACIETCSLQTAPELWKALKCLRKVGGMAMMGCGAPGL